ncbi:MAG: pyridoxamine 5'-phosphate oxidase family protein [Alphaproteobacteria bacterium]
MQKASRDFILSILDKANDLTIATNRPDGWPQATTVSFVHDGLIIYFGVGMEGQKAKNIARDKRVSIVVDVPFPNWQEIKGLSMAAEAEFVTDPKEIMHFGELMVERFGDQVKEEFDRVSAQLAKAGGAQKAGASPLEAVGMAVVRARPKLVSILDYTKGFGHTELAEVSASDLK